MKKPIFNLLKKYWVIFSILIIIYFGVHVRLLDYNWPYLRNIDSYTFFRQMDDIVNNNGTIPEHDPLVEAPYGVNRELIGHNFYVYAGAYSYMFFRMFMNNMPLWEFLVWFPPLLASFAAVPIYFIGKILYDRRAGVIAALFVVFESSIMRRTLGGDPDSDAIILLIPLVVITLFLFSHKFSSKNNLKKMLPFSLLTGVALAAWGFTWTGHWWVVWLITGFFIAVIAYEFILTRNIKALWRKTKYIVINYALIMLIFFTLTIPIFGLKYVGSTYLGPLTFHGIKSEEGASFPNVYVSVQELQEPGNLIRVVQETSLFSFTFNVDWESVSPENMPSVVTSFIASLVAFFISPMLLMMYAIFYLSYASINKKKLTDNLTMKMLWFLIPLLIFVVSIGVNNIYVMGAVFTYLLVIMAIFFESVRSKAHLNAFIFLSIWFLGPFIATIFALRFSIMLASPIILGSAIIISKISKYFIEHEKLED